MSFTMYLTKKPEHIFKRRCLNLLDHVLSLYSATGIPKAPSEFIKPQKGLLGQHLQPASAWSRMMQHTRNPLDFDQRPSKKLIKLEGTKRTCTVKRETSQVGWQKNLLRIHHGGNGNSSASVGLLRFHMVQVTWAGLWAGLQVSYDWSEKQYYNCPAAGERGSDYERLQKGTGCVAVLQFLRRVAVADYHPLVEQGHVHVSCYTVSSQCAQLVG